MSQVNGALLWDSARVVPQPRGAPSIIRTSHLPLFARAAKQAILISARHPYVLAAVLATLAIAGCTQTVSVSIASAVPSAVPAVSAPNAVPTAIAIVPTPAATPTTVPDIQPSLIVSLIAVAISLASLWRTQLSPFTPVVTVGSLAIRIYPVEPDEHRRWFIASAMLPVSISNEGGRTGQVLGMRLKLHYPALGMNDNREFFHAAFRIDPVKMFEAGRDRWKLLEVATLGHWQPYAVLPLERRLKKP